MNVKQKIAIITPPVLVAVIYPIFQSLAGVMNDRIAWYVGLIIYWLIDSKRIRGIKIEREKIN